jgi:hypothetical protein
MAEIVLTFDTTSGKFFARLAEAAQIASQAITSAKIAPGAVGNTHLAAEIDAGKIVTGAFPDARLASGITAGKLIGTIPALPLSGRSLADLGTRAHSLLQSIGPDDHHIQFTSGMHSFPHPSNLIGDAAIISAKIGANVIATPHIRNQGILSASIGALQIGTPHIADQAILSAKIGANIIGTPHIQAGGILSAAIGALQIGAPHIAWLGITSGKYAGLSIQAPDINWGAITSGKILSGTQFAGIIGADRFTKARIEIASGKLWQGAGPGADPTEIDVPVAALAIFGDGSDGDVTIATNTTLSRDMFYTNLTINSGVTLNPNGYRIFVRGTLTNNGTIARNGDAGGNATGATTAGGGGAGLSTGTLGGSAAGGAGGVAEAADRGGAGGGGGSGGGVIGIYAKFIINNGVIQANGGNGGNGWGGTNTYGTLAKSGGSGGSRTLSLSGGRSLISAFGWDLAAVILGGSGGGGGAGNFTAGSAGSATNPSLGGPGGAGGATPTVPASTTSSGGGGGGGGGGCVFIVYSSATWGVEQALGGSGGAHGGGAYPGSAGSSGSSGLVIKLSSS